MRKGDINLLLKEGRPNLECTRTDLLLDARLVDDGRHDCECTCYIEAHVRYGVGGHAENGGQHQLLCHLSAAHFHQQLQHTNMRLVTSCD